MNITREDTTLASTSLPYLCHSLVFEQTRPNMIRSMTGYGKSEILIEGTPCTIEARCVNGRYLELSTRIPKEWS
ncbi:MAG: hypothetical protein KBB72_09480, partial [Candidatus Kapabacteria bacterium]|nr:hypothetical protein [Candidatus Kapabacteria bacterium]